MSAILAGLVRRNHDVDHNINWDSFKPEKIVSIEGNENVAEIITGKEKKQSVALEPYYNVTFEKFKGEIEIFTSNERFVLNSYKRNISKNASSFVPKVFFAFRPAYAVQISCRFIMKLLTGSTDKQEISFLLQQNSQALTRYFENIRIISEFVFTGGLLKEPTPESENICQQILMGLVEVFVAQNSKENEVVELNHNHLIAFGDSSSILNGDQAEWVCNSEIYRKFGK